MALHAIRDQKILFCVLNWGLGHASRSTPIIKSLMQNNEVHVASDGFALDLLKKEFPTGIFHSLPSYNITYSRSSLALDMALQLPKITAAFAKEKSVVKKLQKDEKYTTIISDHRYGCRTKETENIFIAHQIRIMSDHAILSKVATTINRSLINQFTSCWIPDEEDSLLSGNLSLTPQLSIPIHYIGIQSRFQKDDFKPLYDYGVILSGPEPARTQLEEKLTSIFAQKKDTRVAIVRGSSEQTKHSQEDHITTFDLLPTVKLNQVINQSKMVICRAGYSSIMDLYSIDKKAILIPTPGQTEQEYLAKHLDRHPLFTTVTQDELDSLVTKL